VAPEESIFPAQALGTNCLDGSQRGFTRTYHPPTISPVVVSTERATTHLLTERPGSDLQPLTSPIVL
jgi:hypothetical protein